jgi:hypothetical protein
MLVNPYAHIEPAGGATLTSSYIGGSTDLTNASSYTFSSEGIGTASADRIVIVEAMGEISDSSLVESDITATLDDGGGADPMSIAGRMVRIVGGGGAGGVYSAFFYLNVTTGTTADIVVSFNSKTMHNCSVRVWNSTGSATVAVTDTLDVNGTSGSITVNTGGFLVASNINQSFTSFTWSAGVTTTDFGSWPGEAWLGGGRGTATGSVTVTSSGGSLLAGVSFEAA